MCGKGVWGRAAYVTAGRLQGLLAAVAPGLRRLLAAVALGARRLLAAVALGLLLLAGGASARAPRGFVGMVLTAPVFGAAGPGPRVNLGRQLDAMVASGVENLRVVFNWSAAQPYGSWSQVPADRRGQFVDVSGVPTSFRWTDQLVALAAKRRLTLLPEVLYAPGWDTAPHPAGTYGIPASDAAYAAFVKALVQRYGPRGSFWRSHSSAVPIRSWQIWNEPNLAIFWPVQPFARSYVALLSAAHAAIKSADPGAKIVLAGMPNFSWTGLQQLYAVRGARRLFDEVAVHPYTRRPQGVITILRKVRQVMNRAGDRHKPLIADEISWPSSIGATSVADGFDFATTQAGQAQNLARLLPLLGRERRTLRLAAFDYYTWAGVEDPGSDAFNFAGLFRIAGRRFIAKPAFYAFRRAALALERRR